MVMCPSQSQTGILLLWILCSITYNSAICIWGLKVQCNETDRQKLLNFKEQVRDSSGMLSAWSNEQDCCGWAGVECDHLTHRVTNLSLPCPPDDGGDCLAGEFSLSNLLELEFLNYLDLSNNNLLFSPPRFSGNFSSKLLHLDLSFNDRFNDPTLELDDLKWLIHVNSLEYLDLSGIHLHTSLWLQSVSILPSLSELHLSSCKLHDINPSLEFVNFTLLQVLDLSANYFPPDSLPKWLSNLSQIWDLDLSYNLFQGHLPETILNFRELKSLKLNNNNLNEPISDWMGQFENLQHLYLSNNFIIGPIPEILGNLSSLIELSLDNNLLNESLPEILGKLPNLEVLHVGDNFLTGLISENHFSHLSSLQDLSLGSPALTFHFDPQWIPSFQLQGLDLAYVFPELPAWLYTQKSVQHLTISNSSLIFEDQDKFWNFVAKVDFLQFFNNSISGDMSKVLLNSKVTWLGGNNFRGELPRISSNVTVFIAVDNSFSGTLSSLLCQKMEEKSSLSYLRISGTQLSGGLTECWMNWKSLADIEITNNGLTGSIPRSMSLLSNLKSLHLSKNNLFGYIPAFLQNYSKLSILNLAENMFSGNIPYWISRSVNVLLLRLNLFSGSIPPQLCELSSLVVLDIAENSLSGPVPNCFYNITAMVSRNTSSLYYGFRINILGLEYLFLNSFVLVTKGNQLSYLSSQEIMCTINLSHNKLIGTIPPEIFILASLQSLNLSKNQFTGSLPKEISDLKRLESLDLSSNLFSGKIPQSMSELSFLSFLNLSWNSFTGQIPQMAQFQRFDALCYIGNSELCGAPLTKICTHEENSNLTKSNEENEDGEEFLSWFYIGIGVGFATGFWGVCASLFFNRTWRHAYFRFLYDLTNRLHVFMVLKLNCFH